MCLARNRLPPIVLVLVVVLVLDLWSVLWTLTIRAFPASKEVENENDDEDENDWEGTYIALSTYGVSTPGDPTQPRLALTGR